MKNKNWKAATVTALVLVLGFGLLMWWNNLELKSMINKNRNQQENLVRVKALETLKLKVKGIREELTRFKERVKKLEQVMLAGKTRARIRKLEQVWLN